MLRILIFFIAFSSYSQSHIGILSERYSGFNGISINPTSFLNSPIDQEINLFGIDLQFETDYGFIKNSSYLDLGDVFSEIKVTNPFKDQSVDDLTINLNKSTKPYSILSSIQFNGPSYIFKVVKPTKVSTYGLGISQRVHISSLALNSGYNYDNFREENFGNEILFDQTNSKLNAANWTEIKLNYSFTTDNSNSLKKSFGLNFKTNISYNSTHFQQESPTKMIYKDVETLLFFNDFRSESRYFVGNADNPFQKRGIGFGLDLGYSIYKKKSDVKENHSYLYKLGVSVLDLGFLSFNKLSEVHVYDIIGPRELDISEVKNYKDMSERVYGDRNKSFKKKFLHAIHAISCKHSI